MNTGIQKLLGCILMAMVGAVLLNSQSTQDINDGEIIIIEKTIDENGNEISRRIIRKDRGDLSEGELQELLEGNVPGNQGFDQFNLDGFGFGSDFFDQLRKGLGSGSMSSKPTLGVSISSEDNNVIITDVSKFSGAEEADLRKGDRIIAVNDQIVATIEDVKNSIEDLKSGDEVKVLVFRDGEELEKSVELRVNNFGIPGFSGEDGSWGRSFFFDGSKWNIDSLFGQFGDSRLQDQLELPEMRRLDAPKDEIKRNAEKPSLGIFIEDDKKGILVTDVIKGSSADMAGIRSGDIILRVDDEMVTTFRELSMLMNQKNTGDVMQIQFERDRTIKEIEVTLK